MRRVLFLSLLVAGCVPPPSREPPPLPPRPAPPPPPRPAPPPPRPVDWRDWPQTPGTWRYERDARGTRALFGTPGTDARAVLRCDRGERRVFLSVSGSNTAPLAVRTTSIARSLPVSPTGGTPPYVAVSLSPTDPLLDAMAFSRGRFALDQAGAPPLALPAWAEVGRVIEDCRG
jgi:hypothetical protein